MLKVDEVAAWLDSDVPGARDAVHEVPLQLMRKC